MRLRRAMWGAMLWIGATAVAAADPTSPGGSVADMAGVLDTDTMLQLDSTLATYASATGFVFSVVTVRDLADEALEDYARLSLLTRMAVQNDPDVRVALLIWSSARQFLIAISPGFGHELSPTEVAAVMHDQVLPQVTAGDVGAGMLYGVYGLMAAAGEPADEQATPQELVMLTRWDEAAEADPLAPTADGPAAAFDSEPTEAVHDGWLHAVGEDPADTLKQGWARAQSQWGEVSSRLRATMADSAGSAGTQAPIVIAAVVALAVLAGVWGVTRSLVAVTVSLGLGAAVACWALTGYAELSVLLALSGIAISICLHLLLAIARNDHEARLQPSPYSAMNRMPSPSQLAVPPAMPTRSTANTSTPGRAKHEPESKARGARFEDQNFGKALAQAHRDGIRTPMLDYLIANKDRLKTLAAPRKQQRQYWLIGIVISFFVFLPLALILMLVWMARELSHLKPPQVSLADFLRQLIAEVRAVSRYQKPGG